jgi:hypothetical protein
VHVVALIVAGLTLEVVGLVLVSAEDLAPWATRGRESLAAARSRLVQTVERWRRKSGPYAPQRVTIKPAIEHDVALPIRAVKMGSAPLEKRVGIMEAETRRAHDRLDQLESQVKAERVSRESAIAALRRELDDAIGSAVETSRLRYVKLRRYGLVCLVAGGACLAVANLV